MNDNWLNKYKSKSINDFENNLELIKNIKNKIIEGEKSLIIKGDSGTGKTTIVELISKELKL